MSILNTMESKLDESKVAELLKKLEKEGEEQVKKVSGKTPEIFIEIMQKGADEFKEKTGRNMTYAEIRAAYG